MQTKTLYLQAVLLLSLAACTNHNSRNATMIPAASGDAQPLPDAPIKNSMTLIENMTLDTSCSLFVKGLESADLVETLTQRGPFILFVPANAAFYKLPAGTIDEWFGDRKNDLANILSFHIVAGSMSMNDLQDGQKLRTLAGEELIVTLRNNHLIVNGTRTIGHRIASNGVIYVLDGILYPKNIDAEAPKNIYGKQETAAHSH